MSTPESGAESIGIVREYNRTVFNNKEYDKIGELQHEEYVQHGPIPGMEVEGNAESLETMRMFHNAFPDLEGTEEFAFTDGEYVCTFYTYRGTHEGEFMGLEPTDESVETTGIVINRIEDGKIAEAWVVADFLSVLQQVGAMPAGLEAGA